MFPLFIYYFIIKAVYPFPLNIIFFLVFILIDSICIWAVLKDYIKTGNPKRNKKILSGENKGKWLSYLFYSVLISSFMLPICFIAFAIIIAFLLPNAV